MRPIMLLHNYVRLMVETMGVQPAFELMEPVKLARSGIDEGEYIITREFPLTVSVVNQRQTGHRLAGDSVARMPQAMGSYDSGNTIDGEHEISIGLKIYSQKSNFMGSLEQPPDPDEFEIEGWMPVTIDGLVLSKQDAQRLKAHIGDLTDEEVSDIQASHENTGTYSGPDDY